MSLYKRFNLRIWLAVFLIIAGTLKIQAQNQENTLALGVSSINGIDSEGLPFFLWANKHGKVNPSASNLVFDLSLTPQRKVKSPFTFWWGIDITSTLSAQNTINFSRLYGAMGFKNIEFLVGRFYRYQGLNTDSLGMGSMLTGYNASALPGVEIRTNNYSKVPFTDGYLNYKFNFGHYFFENNRFVKNAYLHSKQFYLQVNLNNLKLNGGIIHNVTWGGESPLLGNLPFAFSDYLRILVSRGARANSGLMGEIETALGNTVAAYDFGISWRMQNFEIDLTRLFYIEDKNAAEFRSVWDGQWSAKLNFLENSYVQKILYEYIYTIRQDAFASQPGGRANYYNHYIYKSGWSYQGNVLGNALLTYDKEQNTITNNMLVGHSFASLFKLLKIGYLTTSYIFTRNYGLCADLVSSEGLGCGGSEEKSLVIDHISRDSVRKNFHYFYLSLDYTIKQAKNVRINTSFAYDLKEGEKNNLGFSVGVKLNLKISDIELINL